MNKDFLERVIRRLRLMLRIAFSRTAIIVVALLLQLFVFFASFYWLKDYSTVVYAAFVLLGAVTVVHILNEENNASFKIAWIIPVLVIPVFGTVLYIYINLQPITMTFLFFAEMYLPSCKPESNRLFVVDVRKSTAK